MKTPSDLISYLRTHQESSQIYKQLLHLWNQAAIFYCDKVVETKYDLFNNAANNAGAFNPKDYVIDFEKFTKLCEELLRKRISAHFKLQVIL
jgi:hypothetical protein